MSLFDKWKNKYSDTKMFKYYDMLSIIIFGLYCLTIILVNPYYDINDLKASNFQIIMFILYVFVPTFIVFCILIYDKQHDLSDVFSITIIFDISLITISLFLSASIMAINIFNLKVVDEYTDKYRVTDVIKQGTSKCILITENIFNKIDYIDCNKFKPEVIVDIIKNKEYFVTTTIEKGFMKKEYITVKYRSNLD